MMQLVAGTGHFDARDLGAVAWRRGIDVQHGKGVVGGRIGIEQRHIGEGFDGGLHGHRRRRIEALVGKQFRHRLAPPRGFDPREAEVRIRRQAPSFKKAGIFLKLS